jgi:LPS-assembly lipoprotein
MWPVRIPALLPAAALLCAGCGFRLAGSEPLPAVMSRPYLALQDSYTDFSREFERRLKGSGARVQSLAADASATVEVTRDQVQRRVLSVSASNIPTEYELTYTVTIAVRAGDKQIMTPQTLSLSRDYSFDENMLLAKENEEDVLRLQMARDLAAIATRRLTSLK